MSENNKYVLEFGFNSGYTKEMYSAYYINEQNNKELLTIKFANSDDPNDREVVLEWFKTISKNHSRINNNKDNNSNVIAEFYANDDEVSPINNNVQAIDFDELYDIIENVYKHDLKDYLDIYVDDRLINNIIDEVKHRYKS